MKPVGWIAAPLVILFLLGSGLEAKPRRFPARPVFKPCTATLPAIDRVELHKLAELGQLKCCGEIVATKSFTGQEAQDIGRLWRNLGYQSGSSICHYPRHAVSFYAGDRMLVRAYICFDCSNISFGTPVLFKPDESNQTLGFDAEGVNGKRLLNLFRDSF